MRKLIISLLITVLFSLTACRNGQETKQDGGRQARQTLTVDASVVSMSSKDFAYNYSGSLLANEAIDLRPEISGKITNIYFKEGAKVKKGDILVKMFDADLQAQLKKNKLQIELQAKEEKRKKELFDLKGISKEEYEISENLLNTLKAEQDLLNAQISKTELVAPFTGIAGLRNVSEGAFVTNTIVITTLQQIDPIKVEFSVPEKYKPNISENQVIEFTVEGLKEIFKGKVYAMESKIDVSTGSIKIRALCSNPEGKLFPGSFVSVKLNLFPNQETIFITARAIVPFIDGEQVFIVKKGRATAVKVITGIRTETEVEIEKGLKPNDTLVTTGLLQIKEGMPVSARIKKEKTVKE
jgi:membrane fusion protein, multidrug efflux system